MRFMPLTSFALRRSGLMGLVLWWVMGQSASAIRPVGELFATRSVVLASHGMVATSQPLATQVGLDILQQGGSAVDAAIAANAALGLMQPMSNGMGGDLFAIVWDPRTRRLHGLNGSGRSPASLTRAEFTAAGVETAIPSRGPLAVTVPGCVDGWFTLHEKFGRLPMREVLQPAIQYAREGFPVSPLTARGWGSFVERNQPFAAPLHGFAETLTHEGQAPAAGALWRNPALADTMERLGRDGRDAFYQGDLAQEIAVTMKACGGFITMADLAAHRSSWVEPVSTNYRGWDVWELPPNGQGIAALQILNMMEGFNLADAGFGSVEHVHSFIEAKKLAYEDRARFYADPDFPTVSVATLLGKDYAEKRRAMIDPAKAALAYLPGLLEQGDTIILCAADAEGMMVSLIQSNSGSFGSGVCVPALGFVLQNRGAMFSLEPGHANEYQPRKRPFHTIIPAFVTQDNQPLMAFGLMGGAMQPQGHAQIIINLRDYEMDLQEAGDAPRIYHTGSTEPYGDAGGMADGGRVLLEPGFPADTPKTLKQFGHAVEERRSGAYGGYQAIWRDPATGVYHGASESRQDGAAAGY